MSRLVVLSSVIVLAFAVASSGSEQETQDQPNRPPLIHSFTSSLKTVSVCPFAPSAATFDEPEVTLFVTATDADGDALQYKYSVTQGRISGVGKSVVWRLDAVPRGPHVIRVTVSDARGAKATSALTVITVDADGCHPPPAPCPVISVSCADEKHQSKPFTFSATVETNAKGPMPPSFKWTINAGRIVKGQNTRKIEVTTKGTAGFDDIIATVDVGGFDASCSATIVSCTTRIIR